MSSRDLSVSTSPVLALQENAIPSLYVSVGGQSSSSQTSTPSILPTEDLPDPEFSFLNMSLKFSLKKIPLRQLLISLVTLVDL